MKNKRIYAEVKFFDEDGDRQEMEVPVDIDMDDFKQLLEKSDMGDLTNQYFYLMNDMEKHEFLCGMLGISRFTSRNVLMKKLLDSF